ncbi:hypothetical protein ACJD0Z_01530 [Flavobacteriaceae bacterium M23B6Z8]
MNHKRNLILFYALILLLSGTSCQEKSDNVSETEDKITISESIQGELPQIIPLTGEAKENVDNWTEFTDFDSELRRIYENDIDLESLLNELLRREKELRASDFPEKFNIPAVQSRLLVLRTYLGRTQAALTENDPSLMHKEKIAVIKAYNALRVQFMDAWKKNIAEEFLKNDSI